MANARAPVVGILTVRQGSDPQRPFAAQTSMLAGFSRHGRELGLSVYVITPAGIHPKRLSGWRFSGRRWKHLHSIPMPDVLYDRVPTRTMEQAEEVQKAKAYFRGRPETVYLGMDFFDKWHVHRAWAHDRRIAQYIPDTVDYGGLDSIQQMLSNHRTIYVKPRSSSLGLGIIRIEGSEMGPWRLSWRDRHGKRHDRIINSGTTLDRFMGGFTHGRPYLVQQGIEMGPYRRRLYDIRAAVHRNLRGEWQVTGIGVRLGFAKSIVTNMAAGAVARPLTPVIREVSRSLGVSSDELTRQLFDVAVTAAEVLGDEFGYRLGEIGLDLAIAKNGHIWLLEANAKPLRTIFQEFDDQKMAEDCLRKPMEYAHFLAITALSSTEISTVGKRGEIE